MDQPCAARNLLACSRLQNDKTANAEENLSRSIPVAMTPYYFQLFQLPFVQPQCFHALGKCRGEGNAASSVVSRDEFLENVKEVPIRFNVAS